MSLLFRILFSVCAGCLPLLFAGCAPATSRQSEEQEPHYVLGTEDFNAMDYRGAIEEFQKSLEANPHSAAAHFQLACLYDQQVPDFAAAIYHYEQYLELNPNAANAAIVKQRIEACKEQLAANVLALPSSPSEQRQIEETTARNRQLQDEVLDLQASLDEWRVYYARMMAAAQTNSLPEVSETRIAPVHGGNGGMAETTSSLQTALERVDPAPVGTSSWSRHTVVPGETAFWIARHYGVSLEALLDANPDVEPRRMAVGTVLNIPPLEPAMLPGWHYGGGDHRHERIVLASREDKRLD